MKIQEKIKVLMIDDNVNLIEMVKEYFSGNENISIDITANDGEEGIKLIEKKQNEYDLILLDLIIRFFVLFFQLVVVFRILAFFLKLFD